ncbi:MAG: hypothetical protein F4Y03_10415 [Alphaproteobacteria bacterium]|nr:hypothetical protein [Alphaproteobacteria bacterium]
MAERTMDADGTGKLRDYVDGLRGVACTLPFERIRELTGLALPAAADSQAWWTDPSGWDAWPPWGACRSAGWRVESVHPEARLVRFRRC